MLLEWDQLAARTLHSCDALGWRRSVSFAQQYAASPSGTVAVIDGARPEPSPPQAPGGGANPRPPPPSRLWDSPGAGWCTRQTCHASLQVCILTERPRQELFNAGDAGSIGSKPGMDGVSICMHSGNLRYRETNWTGTFSIDAA